MLIAAFFPPCHRQILTGSSLSARVPAPAHEAGAIPHTRMTAAAHSPAARRRPPADAGRPPGRLRPSAWFIWSSPPADARRAGAITARSGATSPPMVPHLPRLFDGG
jgi:hypothetical protein